MFLLIFATAVASIAADFGFARWEDLMPFGVGAFVMFGLGSLPVGPARRPLGPPRDDDRVLLRHRRVVAAGVARARRRGSWPRRSTLIGTFASIYHPVGIPMLLQGARGRARRSASTASPATSASRSPRRHRACSINGSAGAPRSRVPGVACIALGIVFLRVVPRETEAPARRKGGAQVRLPRARRARARGDDARLGHRRHPLQPHDQRQRAVAARAIPRRDEDPATLGLLLASIYAVASLAQVVVGRLIDRVAAEAALPVHGRCCRCRCCCSRRRRRAGGSTPACSR